MTRLISLWPAFASGSLLACSFAPFGVWALAYIALVPLLYAARDAGAARVILLYGSTGALLACAIYYGTIAYSPWFFCALLAIFFVGFTLWGLLVRWVLARLHGPVARASIPALIWTGIEAITGSELIGVPANLGVSQAGQLWLIQSASLFGVYGVSFLIVLTNTAVAHALAKSAGARIAPRYAPLGAAMIVMTANIAFGYVRLNAVDATPTVKVAAVQPVISPDMYRNGWRQPDSRRFMKQTLEDLTAEAAASGADIVFWSEGGNGYMNMRIDALRERIFQTARDARVDLIVSSNDIDEQGRKYNSLFSISRHGALLDRYDKVRLVPMAEAEYTAGTALHTLRTSFARLGAVICFESAFPSLLRRLSADGAQILFVASSEATLKRTSLIFAHRDMAVFRAVENGRWLVRAANTGPSAVISPRGEVVSQSAFYARGILVGQVAPLTEKTFFTRAGYFIPNAFAAFVLMLTLYALYSARANRYGGTATPATRPTRVSARDTATALIDFRKRLQALLAFGAAHAAFMAVIAGASLYLVSADTIDSPGYGALLTDFIAPAPAPQEQVTERFLQAKMNTCGAAALGYTLSYFGRETREAEVLRETPLLREGISMLALKQAAQRFGFDAIGVQQNYSALRNEVLPAIAYINNNHYVVVIAAQARHVLLFDPALGHIKVSRPLFEHAWKGYLLRIRVKPLPDSVNAYAVSFADDSSKLKGDIIKR